jgi:hypothetical protein
MNGLIASASIVAHSGMMRRQFPLLWYDASGIFLVAASDQVIRSLHRSCHKLTQRDMLCD